MFSLVNKDYHYQSNFIHFANVVAVFSSQ